MADLELSGISKAFGAVVALSDVSASFRGGEIHAVLGENGAGKSTLMSVLSGFVAPDAGTATLDGVPVPLGNAAAAKRMGIEMVHQHFALVPEFTVAENLALTKLLGLARPIDANALAEPALSLAGQLGWRVPADARVGDLPVGTQQRLEILKAISGEARVVVFDEPTAVLAPDEVEDLFRVLRTLRDEGRTVILIAHKLAEVMAVADRVTVLRRGKTVATAPIGDVCEQRLAEWMVGELPSPGTRRLEASASGEGLAISGLVVRGDRGEEAVRGLSLTVGRGEIVGIGGVDGNGQVELAEAVVGVRPAAAGDIRFAGGAARIAYVPQDRQTDGLAMGMSIAENLLISAAERPGLTRGPLLRLRQVRAWATNLIQRFGIKADGPDVGVATLSGGNQQKVVVGRALDADPNLLVVVNPTRGLDIRATEYVHAKLREARGGGAAVLLLTTDLDELYALSDRTLFLNRGQLREDTGAAALVGGSAR